MLQVQQFKNNELELCALDFFFLCGISCKQSDNSCDEALIIKLKDSCISIKTFFVKSLIQTLVEGQCGISIS